MDVLKFEGKNYVKASVIARDLGYTSDYVGQLCRAEKIPSRLVGRSWYVDEVALTEHKYSRYRGTQKKSLEAVHLDIHSDDTTVQIKRKGASNPHYATYNKAKPVGRYIADAADLLPTVKKTGSLELELADASTVDVTSADEKYTFTNPKLPTLKFKGSLEVTDLNNLTREEKGDAMVLYPQEVDKLFTHKRSVNNVISEGQEIKHSKKTRSLIATDLNSTEPESVSITEVPVSSLFAYKFTLAVSSTLSLCLVVVFLGLESHVAFTADSIATTYSFNIENVKNLFASVYSSFL